MAVDVSKPPNDVQVVLADKTAAVAVDHEGRWTGDGVEVTVDRGTVTLKAPTVAVKKLHLHWNGTFGTDAQFLGDAWERAYGDLQWKPVEKTGPMPWYFFAGGAGTTDGYGVMTGPAAMCCWKVDRNGADLWADVRSGGVGVELGDRALAVCTIVFRPGVAGESAFAADQALCRLMCPHPRPVKQPIYGFNDWYCTYGKNTADGFLKDAAYIASLSPTTENKPFMVIDDGWQASRQGGKSAGNPWDRTNEKFGSTMADVAAAIKAMGGRPGLWYRPLEAWPDCPPEWHLAGRKNVLDPSNPEVLKVVAENMRRFHGWGYEMIKHDFSTEEITGKWGNHMGEQITPDGWAFGDKSKTTAEIVLHLYKTLRDGGGDDTVINGCNTISHLSAGVFEMARIGDDTSGTEWNRTRDMGVNCLAFRAAQNGAFYQVDADCAGLAKAGAVPWEKNKQWLDLLSRSGTPVFVSWPKRLVGPEQETTLRAALLAASKPQPTAEPLDWTTTRTPTRWKLDGTETTFSW